MEKISKYKIVGEISRGSMGVIYEGLDESLSRNVAIKTMNEALVNDKTMIERFKTEAKAAAMLNHPNIVTIYELGEENGIFFIVMELLKGKDLKTVLDEEGAMSLAIKLDILIQISKGLSYAHSKNVIHRDIKPANIVIRDDNLVKITDFGIAHLESSQMTYTGMIFGTPDYMSPEQVNSKEVDCRSDIFSTGIILYQVMTGKKPFLGSSISAVLYKIANEPPPLDDLDKEIPKEILDIIIKALEKDPQKRYQSIEMMLEDLRTARRNLILTGHDETLSISVSVPDIMKEAEKLLEEKRPEEALYALKRAKKIEPENQALLQLLKKAEERLQEEKQGRIRNILIRAETASTMKRDEEALSIAKTALKILPDNPTVKEFIDKIKERISEQTGETMLEIENRIGVMEVEEERSSYTIEPIPGALGDTQGYYTASYLPILYSLPSDLRTMIEEADNTYYQRKSIVEVIFSTNILLKAFRLHPGSYELLWRLSRNYYMKGMLVVDVTEKRRSFRQGISLGKKAIKIDDLRVDGFYWLGVNVAKLADVLGVPWGLALMKSIKKILTDVIKRDDRYSGGGAYRVLGRMKSRIPGIVGGSWEESISLLNKALSIAPDHPDTLLFIAEALMEQKKYEEAMKHINTLMEMDPPILWKYEVQHNRKIAEELLVKLDNLLLSNSR
jgi:tetratricopeptide (TPR) repeat protein